MYRPPMRFAPALALINLLVWLSGEAPLGQDWRMCHRQRTLAPTARTGTDTGTAAGPLVLELGPQCAQCMIMAQATLIAPH